MNAETKYVINILISMIPIGIVGVFFKDTVETNLWIRFIGRWLYAAIDGGFAGIFVLCKPRQKESISMKDAFIIGLAQACA